MKRRAAKELILACVLVGIIPWKQLGVLWVRGLIKLGFNLVRWAGGGAQIWALGVPLWWKIDGNNRILVWAWLPRHPRSLIGLRPCAYATLLSSLTELPYNLPVN